MEAAGECALPGGGRAATDSLVVALPGAVDPAHAPLPQSDAEHFVFRALYETLLRVDCTGRPLPALAQAWTPEDGGRRWTFVLRQDARFWDGEPVTAHDVVAAWTAHDTLGALAPWDGPVAQAAQVMSDRVLAVRLRRPSATAPLALAHPGLAVTKRAPGLGWPIGTGRYWVSGSADVILAPAFGDRLPPLRLRALAGGDARDALDDGADLLVTDDPAVLAYAATRSDLEAAPLPWDRVYVMAQVPGRSSAGDAFPSDAGALGRDAVRVEARAPDGPAWWASGSSCAAAPAPVSGR
ncbi:MAG TPA: ABC transporter substrate-binding protein, partial [Methylomirabilota bacterium]|nr:ABC transporter substrate-binding protein [Methylomirabilota bacterium]